MPGNISAVFSTAVIRVFALPNRHHYGYHPRVGELRLTPRKMTLELRGSD
jgi:hypothetical protein